MEELTERVDALELETDRINFVINGIQRRSKSQSSKQDKVLESIDKRFEHVYGELADLKADAVEIRNILASVVQRQEKHSELLNTHTELLKQILAKLP